MPDPCDVLGVGENSVDFVYRLPGYPHPGGVAKMEISSASRSPGGQVTTTLCACAALGLTTAYIGAFGDDENGRLIRDELHRRGINLDRAPVRHGPNRYAVILVNDRTGERVVLWHRDRSLALRPGDVTPDALRGVRLLHVDAVDEAIAIRAARLARDAGLPVTSDIDRVTDVTRDLVAAVTVPIFAEGVAEELTGESDGERALRALRRQHAGLLCVTRGARGAILLAGDELHRAPALSVDVVDTTGAGDVFRGAFIHALLRGDAPADILTFATAAAAVSCTRAGAISSVPTLREIGNQISTGT